MPWRSLLLCLEMKHYACLCVWVIWVVITMGFGTYFGVLKLCFGCIAHAMFAWGSGSRMPLCYALALGLFDLHVCCAFCPSFGMLLATVLGWAEVCPFALHDHISLLWFHACLVSQLHACILLAICISCHSLRDELHGITSCMFGILHCSCCIFEPSLYTCIALFGLGCQAKLEGWGVFVL